MSKTVWIVHHCEDETGPESIIKVFEDKDRAIHFIGENALASSLNTRYLSLVKMKVH